MAFRYQYNTVFITSPVTTLEPADSQRQVIFIPAVGGPIGNFIIFDGSSGGSLSFPAKADQLPLIRQCEFGPAVGGEIIFQKTIAGNTLFSWLSIFDDCPEMDTMLAKYTCPPIYNQYYYPTSTGTNTIKILDGDSSRTGFLINGTTGAMSLADTKVGNNFSTVGPRIMMFSGGTYDFMGCSVGRFCQSEVWLTRQATAPNIRATAFFPSF